MKVLMISADSSIFMPGSPAAERMREYAGLFDELHIVVFACEYHEDAHDGNLFLYAAYGALLARLFRAWRLGYACMRRNAGDVITAQGADETGVVAWILAHRFGVPFQLQIHTDIMNPRYRRTGWKERVRYQMARFLIPRAACVRVVSERIQRSIIEPKNNLPQTTHPYKLENVRMSIGRSMITVLPIFTDVSRFVSAAPDLETERRFADYDFKIIAVGRFVDKEKNFSMLIGIMREFIKICPRALLVIVGEGSDRMCYESRIKNQGLEKNVILESWRDDLPSFYKSFDLFVSPSHYEGWGRAVIEAMAAGLPVVMTDTGLAGEVVKNQENGIVVPVGDQGAFLQAMKILYENQEKRKLLVNAGRETAKNLQPATREDYLVLYKKSIESCGI